MRSSTGLSKCSSIWAFCIFLIFPLIVPALENIQHLCRKCYVYSFQYFLLVQRVNEVQEALHKLYKLKIINKQVKNKYKNNNN